jgi:hypothetical protein
VYPLGLDKSTTRTDEHDPQLADGMGPLEIRTPTPRDSAEEQKEQWVCEAFQANLLSGKSWSSSTILSVPSVNSSLALFEDRRLASIHIDAYFKHVHPVGCFGFLHELTIRNQVQLQTISSTLLLSMCATSTRFVDHSVPAKEVLRRGQLWADQAKTMIFQRLADYDLDTLACLVLQFHHALANAQFETIRLLAPVAARMAMGLGLYEEVDPCAEEHGLTEPVRETRRRLIWACQVFDWFTGAGERSSMNFKAGMIKVRLPTSDEDFEVGRASDMPFLEEEYYIEMGNRRQSRLGAYIWLMSLKARVIQWVYTELLCQENDGES